MAQERLLLLEVILTIVGWRYQLRCCTRCGVYERHVGWQVPDSRVNIDGHDSLLWTVVGAVAWPHIVLFTNTASRISSAFLTSSFLTDTFLRCINSKASSLVSFLLYVHCQCLTHIEQCGYHHNIQDFRFFLLLQFSSLQHCTSSLIARNTLAATSIPCSVLISALCEFLWTLLD